MNERIEKLAEQAEILMTETKAVHNTPYGEYPLTENQLLKFAELIIQECTQLLFAESERLYAYSSECDNMRYSDEAELCAEKCMDNIKMIEEHFGVE